MDYKIINFLIEKHIVHYSVFLKDKMWSSSSYYVFDKNYPRFIILTSSNTRHGQLMLENPLVTGIIASDTINVSENEGIQFNGEIYEIIEEDIKKNSLELYYNKFPYARIMQSQIWHILLKEIKYTNNKLGFGHKIIWKK